MSVGSIYKAKRVDMKEKERCFCDFLQMNNIICNVAEKNGKVVLGNLIGLLKRHFPDLDEDSARREIESREELFPTVIAPGLAVPHARISGLKEPLVAVGCIPEGCDFGVVEPVKVMILLLTPMENPNLHIQVLSALAVDFGADNTVEKVSKSETSADLVSAFSRAAAQIPDYLKASDLMTEFPAVLQETDSILDAIKIFSVTRSEELPVIDNTGDLRGVLSLGDLLKYSLPEHLLWLEDLSPIYQLQPFSDMLETADENKVADVMREEFEKIDADAPAVELAKNFLVNKLSQLIVTDHDGKPAGVVTLKDFSAKLFWD